jgi:leukotriene-A4 hydrolase
MRHRVSPFVVLVAACSSAGNRGDAPAAMPTTASTTANDVHSCARPDEVVVRHVALDLDLDFAQKVARGTCALTVERRVHDAPLWLDTQDLTIEAATADDGRPVPFQPRPVDPILGTPLRVDLPAGCTRVTLR